LKLIFGFYFPRIPQFPVLNLQDSSFSKMMKLLLATFCLILWSGGLALGQQMEDQCAADIATACFQKKVPVDTLRSIDTCNSNYGGFTNRQYRTVEEDMQNLIGQHLSASMQYLLIASRFNEWKMDRKGFHALYSKMSDDAFNEAVAMIQHMNMRGGRLETDFNITMPTDVNYQMSELESLSKVLAIEKQLAKNTLLLINSASHAKLQSHHSDGELALFLAEQISGNHSPRIKSLAAHVNNLGQAIAHGLEKNNDPAYVVYLYDTQFL
jgi:ferritin